MSDDHEVSCKHCGSPRVSKFGTYKGVQRYWCNDCQRKFKADGALFHMKKPADHVTGALSMYYMGMSIDDICDQCRQQYGYHPSKATVYEWIEKYTKEAIEQFRGYHPKVGNAWVADETVLKTDAGKVWLWDIIDARTRYLLATRVSLTRTTYDAQCLFELAAQRAGKEPKVVYTDKLAAYLDGIPSAYTSGTDHRQGSPFNIEDNTNLIERWHGTLKERTKVMRGLKDIETLIQFTDGFLVHYNYFRPHEALKNKTPAEAAHVNYTVKNWADLCRSKTVSKHAEKKSHHREYVVPKSKLTRPRVTERNLPPNATRPRVTITKHHPLITPHRPKIGY